MAKKNNNFGISNDTIQWIVIVVAIILAIKYLPALKGTNINQQFGGFSFNAPPATPSTENCMAVNIGTEFDRYFADLSQPKQLCNGINPGGWTQDSREISCNVLSNAVIDCNQPFAQYGNQLCNYLNANWVCRPDFMGCLCGRNAPNPPAIQDNDGDGIPDNIDPDDDNDGYPDTEEIQEGTDPNDPNSYPGSDQQTKYYCCLAMGVQSCYANGCPPAGQQIGNYYTSLSACQAVCTGETTVYCDDICQNAGYDGGSGPVDSPGGCNYPEVYYVDNYGNQCCCYYFEEQGQSSSVGTIFVTKNYWSGAMGGLNGMYEKCQVSANYAGLSGTWIALASDLNTQAKDRIPDTAYYLLNGNMIASSKADLFDRTIITAINVDEYGNKVPDSTVWTATKYSGVPLPGWSMNCHDWSWISEGYVGGIGSTSRNDYGWIDIGDGSGSGKPCDQTSKIYCIRIS